MPPPPLKPLSLGELLDVAFGLYRALFIPLLIVTLVTAALPLAIAMYVDAAGGTLENLPLVASNYLLDMVLSSVGTAATTIIVAESYVHRSISAGEAFRRAAPFLGRVFVATILMILLFSMGLMLFIFPGFIVITGLAVTTPALVVENLDSSMSALSRSWSLTRGHKRRIFGACAVVLLLMGIPLLALGGYAATRAGVDPSVGIVYSTEGLVLNAVAAILAALVRPLFYCVLTVIYYDLRVRKEAYDLELIAGGMATP